MSPTDSSHWQINKVCPFCYVTVGNLDRSSSFHFFVYPDDIQRWWIIWDFVYTGSRSVHFLIDQQHRSPSSVSGCMNAVNNLPPSSYRRLLYCIEFRLCRACWISEETVLCNLKSVASPFTFLEWMLRYVINVPAWINMIADSKRRSIPLCLWFSSSYDLACKIGR